LGAAAGGLSQPQGPTGAIEPKEGSLRHSALPTRRSPRALISRRTPGQVRRDVDAGNPVRIADAVGIAGERTVDPAGNISRNAVHISGWPSP